MLFTILCSFKPGAYSNAKHLRLEHYEFLSHHMADIVEGGPLLGPDEIPTAMLIVVDRETIEEAQNFISSEPYTHNCFFESVAIRHWAHVLPEPTPGYVLGELDKEHKARTSG